MLVKLLSDYQPRGVAICWDTKPVHRTAISGEYKADRRPMPDLLEQFPHFRPIVEAFGYRNLEFEGWEADDVIATLATRADEAGVKTCVVSTDRDAFQLCTENVCLMMTPRGVADVHVYTPERVQARYGVTPEQVPDFIGIKGDTSDNIPGSRASAKRPRRRSAVGRRGRARARRRSHAGACEGDPPARRAGA
jgi:DNA polymerase-1